MVIRRCILTAIFFSLRMILKIRYQIKIEGFEKITSNAQGGILFLPNHPAQVDPIILMAILGPRFSPRGVIVEHFYRLKGLRKLFDFIRVIPIPTMADQVTQWSIQECAKATKNIEEAISKGDNVVVYPSGRLQRFNIEKIGGASLVHDLLVSYPKTPAVLVRISGLWGSCLSKAETGETPPLLKTLKGCFWKVLQNGIFFMPKRKVSVEFEPIPFEVSSRRLEFNQTLETWYGQNSHPIYVPYLFWEKKREKIYQAKEKEYTSTGVEVPQDVKETISSLLQEMTQRKDPLMDPSLHLAFDLGLDSLNIADLCLALDKKYGVGQTVPGSLHRIQDLYAAVMGEEKIEERIKPPLIGWKETRQRVPLFYPEASTLVEALLRSCDARSSSIACADHISGAISYQKFKIASLALSLLIRDMKGSNIGVLMPSSVTTYVLIHAILMAGKTPVMMNWTAGKTALEHARVIGEVFITITSKKFLDRICLEDLGNLQETFVFLEELKKKLSWKKKLSAAIYSHIPTKYLLKILPIDRSPDQKAVYLFTSGTEALPKAVGLTHRNIIENQKQSFAYTKMHIEDSFYGVLPPFHSFGFSLTGLFPLYVGLKVFYSPDPTNGKSMALDIKELEITTICLAPSFIRNLISSAPKSYFNSLRLVVSGAEKMTEDLRKSIEKQIPSAMIIEGYGITECSPVVSLQKMGEKAVGVGKILEGIDAIILDLNSMTPIESGQGEICLYGKTIFEGYLGNIASPFIEIKGKKWYRTGDLGYVDPERNLHLTDRLKRTVKIGGELISLAAIEEKLIDIAKQNSWCISSTGAPLLAVVAKEGEESRAELIVFSPFELDKDTLNVCLRDAGFGRIIKISSIVKIKEIPLTGTGKIYYRGLQELLT